MCVTMKEVKRSSCNNNSSNNNNRVLLINRGRRPISVSDLFCYKLFSTQRISLVRCSLFRLDQGQSSALYTRKVKKEKNNSRSYNTKRIEFFFGTGGLAPPHAKADRQ